MLPEDLHIFIVKHLKGDGVLMARRVCKTWNSFLSNAQLVDVFVRDVRSIRFLFERIWLNDRLSDEDCAFYLSGDKYSELYKIVWTMATKETEHYILSFALSLNKELTSRYSSDKERVRRVLEHVFKYLDRFYIKRMGMPCLADQLLLFTAP